MLAPPPTAPLAVVAILAVGFALAICWALAERRGRLLWMIRANHCRRMLRTAWCRRCTQISEATAERILAHLESERPSA